MATLEAGTTPRAATNQHHTLNKFSGDTYLRKYLQNYQAGREEREQESAMICKKAKIDARQSGRLNPQ